MDDYLRTEVEFDIDSENRREIHIIVKSPARDLTGVDLYDALHCLVHDILEPELRGKVNDGSN